MPRNTAMKTIKLPVRFGRFLARKLDPRRRQSLEDSLRIGGSRLEQRQQRLDERAAERSQQSRATDPPAPAEDAHQAQQRKGRRRIRRAFGELGSLVDIGAAIIRVVSVVVRGLLRVIGGLLDGLSVFDI